MPNQPQSTGRLLSPFAKTDKPGLPEKPLINPTTNSFVFRLDTLLEKYYQDETFDVSKLAQKLYVCRMQVHRMVSKHTGMSPGKYLLKFRLNKALGLLLSTDLPINEIAHKSGFTSQINFSKAFRRVFNCSPSSMRKRMENESYKME